VRLLSFVLTIVAASALAFAATAAACDPNGSNIDGNWYDGWSTGPPSGTCINGSDANILVYSPYVEYQDVSAWTMLYNYTTAAYGQVGYLKGSDGNMWDFTETNTIYVWDQQFFSPYSVGSDPQFKVTFSSDAFHYFIDGSNILTDSYTGYTGCHAEQEGEVTNDANQMVGDTSTYVYFTYAQARRADTGAWYDLNGSAHADSPPYRDPYAYYRASNSHLDIWDPECSS
jgi:hypothetical protein